MAKIFIAEQFTATAYDSAEDKAKWANAMASWILRGFPENGWREGLYYHLYQHMYCHIAHFNRHGFYATWFADIYRQLDWLRYAASGGPMGCLGDPTHTWSDVERAFQSWIRVNRLIASWEAKCNAETEIRERAQLAHLKEKYEQKEVHHDSQIL